MDKEYAKALAAIAGFSVGLVILIMIWVNLRLSGVL